VRGTDDRRSVMGINGDYLTMAEACGEVEPRGVSFVPGVDFDPYDEYDVQAVRGAMENSRFDSLRRLERDNASLRAELARLSGDHDDEGYEEACENVSCTCGHPDCGAC
jgi:hypothetical protein